MPGAYICFTSRYSVIDGGCSTLSKLDELTSIVKSKMNRTFTNSNTPFKIYILDMHYTFGDKEHLWWFTFVFEYAHLFNCAFILYVDKSSIPAQLVMTAKGIITHGRIKYTNELDQGPPPYNANVDSQ